ncbi:hypothetical protein K0U91_01155 [Chryseobacterium chendengshani]|uniref:hypothetical protein n=1 Tax=Chryseobacterium sp. LJ668 TaxID=2864040 RepID=UPI001C692724|nr:hypothetical protein [Chryseobacterium sp. LJ668]MBW8523832.1 hypothetical protein [Chryseobacterium sp. LJ668]QYK16775.1 hypothetical protein K0U91_01155 [Chryseobacterium sp. LJ668]
MAKHICLFSKGDNFGKEAGRVRKVFEQRNLKDFKIISVEYKAPAIAEVKVNVMILFKEIEYRKKYY